MDAIELGGKVGLGEGEGVASVTLDAGSVAGLGAALSGEGPMPDPDWDVGTAKLAVEGPEDGRTIPFAGTSVAIEAGVEAALISRTRAAAVREAIGLGDPASALLSGLEDSEHGILLFRAGYNLAAEASGEVALGATPGAVAIGVSAGRSRTLAVARRLDAPDGAAVALRGLAADWRPPQSVTAPGTTTELDPGTWLVSEVQGTVGGSVGLRYGFDYSWVREGAEGALVGDVGLELAAKVTADIEMKIAGRMAVMVSRPDERPRYRVRVERLRSRSGRAALGLEVSANPTTLEVPESPAELLRAAAGTDARRLLGELAEVREALADGEALGDRVAGLTLDAVDAVLGRVVGGNLAAVLEKARSRLGELLSELEDAAERTGTFLVGELQRHIDAASLESAREFADELDGELEALLEALSAREHLRARVLRLDYVDTPLGRWIDGVVGDDLMELLISDAAEVRIRSLADDARSVLAVSLEGDRLLPSLVSALREFFEPMDAAVDEVEAALDTTPEEVRTWIAAKVAEHVNGSDLVEDLRMLRTQIDRAFSRLDELYEKGLEAARTRYEAKLAWAYQWSSSREALFDVTLDFDEDGMEDVLEAILSGDLTPVFVDLPTGMAVHRGALTHRLSKTTRVDLALPGFTRRTTARTAAAATLEFVSEGGSVLGLGFEATNTVTVSGRYRSILSVSASRLDFGPGVQVHGTASLGMSSEYRRGFDDADVAELYLTLQPWARQLFPGAFTDDPGGVTGWLRSLDHYLDRVEPENGNGALGDTLVTLRSTVPAAAGAAWLDHAPRSTGDDESRRIMQALGLSIQSTIRAWMHGFFFSDPDRYSENLDLAGPYLVWTALPPSVQRDGRYGVDGFTLSHIRVAGPPPEWREAVIPRLAASLGAAEQAVQGSRFADRVRWLEPEQAGRFFDDLSLRRTPQRIFHQLLRAERDVVEGIRESVLKLGEARRDWESSATAAEREGAVADALHSLAEFSAVVATSFNEEVDFPRDDELARALGPMLFVTAAEVFQHAAGDDRRLDRPAFELELNVVRNGSVDLAAWVAGQAPDPEATLLKQRIFSR